ncbi:MAG TPA: hypothetical protein VKS82_28405 [Streptosporangiaceae bacterium]|nr:hypothetical protein [Streptosporangiaceae bacterium]
MRARTWLTRAAVAASGLLLAITGATAAPGAVTPPTASGDLIYVATASSGPVTVYGAGSHGSVAPVSTVDNPHASNTVWDPWGVTFDSAGDLFVQSFLSDATTFVFPPGASGSTPPSRIFRAQGPDNESIAVDGDGYEYVAGGEAGASVAVEPPGASGSPGNLYGVTPVRQFPLNENFSPWPDVLATNSGNDLIAAVTLAKGNAIEVFRGGASGGSKPIRTISGPDTGLGSCGSSSTCAELSVTFSPLTGRIYAAVSDGTGSHIDVFAGLASGDAKPLHQIEGPATKLAGKFLTGIAVSPSNGTIYAMAKNSEFGPGRIDAYGRTATGNAAPLRSFTDSSSGFKNAEGIAVTT